MGIYKIIQKVSKRYTWDNLVLQARDYVKFCYVCQRIKERNFKIKGTLGSKDITRVNENWMADVYHPMINVLSFASV